VGPDDHSPAVLDSFRKLDPRIQIKNPVMPIVEIGSVNTWASGSELFYGTGTRCLPDRSPSGCGSRVVCHSAEAMAEAARHSGNFARLRLRRLQWLRGGQARGRFGRKLRAGDIVRVKPAAIGDGEVMRESRVSMNRRSRRAAPVIHEAGGDRSAVTGSTTVLSDG
jgi:K+-transporting ATPase ATPase B chain